VIGCDHRVELSSHRAHKYSVGGKRSADAGAPGGRREDQVVFVAKAATIAGVRVQRAERYARLLNSEPPCQILARNCRRHGNFFSSELSGDSAQRDVSRREHHAKRITSGSCWSRVREHHRHARPGEMGEHLGVAGKVVSAGEKRRLVDWRGDDACDSA